MWKEERGSLQGAVSEVADDAIWSSVGYGQRGGA